MPALNDRFRYAHLNANGTTTLVTGPGKLHSIIVSTAGATATATVFDNITNSGTVIAVSSQAVGTYIYDVAFVTGLTVTLAGTTPGDLTVTYTVV